MLSGFVMFFCRLSFLGYRFSRRFVVFFSGLGFLLSGRFGGSFVVFFSGLGFLLSGRFGGSFVVFFRSLGFLLSGRFGSGFVMFFMMSGFGQWCCELQPPEPEWCLLRQQRKQQKTDP
ncbi:Uncharacterised protein [Raoultella ornithinolytica]|nr:Uncharacterised protein [Raoultella ornithinolytica]